MTKAEVLQVVENRQYIFCVAYFKHTGGDWRSPKNFVLLGKDRKRALSFARDVWGDIEKVLFYPKNYIRDARELVEQGFFC